MKVPSYLSHKGPDGKQRARVIIHGKSIYLGAYGSPESHRRYAEEITRWRANPGPRHDVSTVGDLLARFLANAQRDYRDAKNHTKREWYNYARICTILTNHFVDLPIADFKPATLKAFRGVMLTDLSWNPRYARRMESRVKSIFAWGVREELIPGEIWHKLQTIKPFAVPRADVQPVPDGDLAKTFPELRSVVLAMVRLQLLTGARPGEIMRLTPGDIQRDGKIPIGNSLVDAAGCWVFSPGEHKTAHHGAKRIILFGPSAQAILEPFLSRSPDTCLFSPLENDRLWRELKRANKQYKPAKEIKTRKDLATEYNRHSYHQAIERACERAKVTPWAPNQLRHNAATSLVREFGWEVARLILGHRKVETTQIYALDSWQSAVEAIRRAG